MASSCPSYPWTDQVMFRIRVLAGRLYQSAGPTPRLSLEPSTCLSYFPPELSEKFKFDSREMRKLMDGHNLEDRDWLFGSMRENDLFCRKDRGGRVFVSPDYNQPMEQQREMTMRRIKYLVERGVFEGWLTCRGPEAEMR
ncbi:Acyl-CoA oxidase [Bertholletia excelsa]